VRYDALDTLQPAPILSGIYSFNCHRTIYQTRTSFSSDGTLHYPERWNSWRAGVFILWSCSLESTSNPPMSMQHIKLCYF